MSSNLEDEKHWIKSVAIPKIFKNSNTLRIHKIEIKFIGAEESFLITNCYRATVDYELNGHHNVKHLVIKKIPQFYEKNCDKVNFYELFHNEIIAYTKLKPAIEQFTKQPFKIPGYFYSDIQRYSASIVLEDFGTKGWRVPTEKYNLSLEHLLVAVKYLGYFHGSGFAMRKVKRKEFDDIASQLKEARYNRKIIGYTKLTFQNGIRRLINTTRRYEPKVDDEFLTKLEELFKNPYEYTKQRVRPIEPFITICHGDFLRNNLAFRYVMKDGKELPSEVMMFDLQTIRISSPMIDMASLLMLSSFSEVRCKNFELIFKTYREELVKTYENFTEETAPEFLSFDLLIKEFIRYLTIGCIGASYFLSFLVEPRDFSHDEYWHKERTTEEIAEEMFCRGGEIVDRELSHQVKELYELTMKYNVDLSENININAYSS